MSVIIELIGEVGVGKFSLCTQYCQGSFSDVPIPYHGMPYEEFLKSITIDTTVHSLRIGYDFRPGEFNALSIKWSLSHGFLLCFDMSKRSTFEYLKTAVEEEMKQHQQHPDADRKPPPVLVLVGTKSDSPSKEVQGSEAKKLAEQWKCSYVETSAKNNVNVALAFETLAENIVKQKPTSQQNKCIVM